MSVEYAIVCDSCGSVGAASRQSAALARKILRETAAWKVNLPDGEDVCGHCRTDNRAVAK